MTIQGRVRNIGSGTYDTSDQWSVVSGQWSVVTGRCPLLRPGDRHGVGVAVFLDGVQLGFRFAFAARFVGDGQRRAVDSDRVEDEIAALADGGLDEVAAIVVGRHPDRFPS